MVGNTDCKQVRVALHGPDSLEAKLASWAAVCSFEPRVFEGDVLCFVRSRNGMILELCFLLKAFDGNRW